MIKAFIFDLDGVIADTEELHYRSWKRLADEEGMVFTRQDSHVLRGADRVESLKYILRGQSVGEPRANDLMHRKSVYFLDLLQSLSPEHAMLGTRPLIEDAKAIGLKMGLGSASRNAHAVLKQLQLHHLFDAIGDGYTVKNKKPAPDVFVWVAGRLDVLPNEVVVFEDSDVGIKGALNGGFHVVGVGDGETSQAHLRLNALAKTHAQQFINFFG